MENARRFVSGCGLSLVGMAIIACCIGGTWLAVRAQNYNNIPIEGESISLTHDTLARSYTLYTPEDYDDSQASPLILMLHGTGGDADNVQRLTDGQFNRLADDNNILVAYPNGLEGSWNDGREINETRAHRDDIDDVGFIAAVVDNIRDDYDIDDVYVAGFSDGGMLGYWLACNTIDEYTAIAAVAAQLAESVVAACESPASIPMMIGLNAEDGIVPPEGGSVRGAGSGTLGTFLSADETVAFWADNNDCQGDPTSDTLSNTNISVQQYSDCAASVIYYSIGDAGHTWAQGNSFLPSIIVGDTNDDINLGAEIWEFFATLESQATSNEE